MLIPRLTDEEKLKLGASVERMVRRIHKDAFWEFEGQLESAKASIDILERENAAVLKHALALQKELALASREREAPNQAEVIEALEFRLSHAWDALQRGAWDELEVALNPDNTAQRVKFVTVMKEPWTKGNA
jgi:hypothetical protein